jgi:4-amino-4-deoxy-L-arabinose transferase-like glycosyltransferase
MPPGSASTVTHRADRPDFCAWLGLAAVVAVAALLRIVLFTGFFGSDEVTYTQVALEIASGRWTVSEYGGALRYGVNLPNAFFMKLFGVGEFSANLWSLLCSLGEVALVFVFAHHLWGCRAALLCGIVIAMLPLHVNLAGRLLADAPLAFFITLSFVLFWVGQTRARAAWYFGAGLAAGFAFWIKEVVAIYCAVFAVYAAIHRTWDSKWLWAVAAGTLMVALNCLLLWAISGDPLHIFRVATAATEKYVHVFRHLQTSPWFYFHHMLADIKHVWIMPYLALGGIAVWLRNAAARRTRDPATGYVVLWALGLFAVFSFTPISFAPLTFIAKQTNYMLIFAAPFCLLAGYFLSRLHTAWLAAALAVLVPGSLLLAALEQQAVHVFTANSKAAVTFARNQPEIPVYATTNAYRAGIYTALMQGNADDASPLRDLSRLTADWTDLSAKKPAQGPVAYAIVDVQTITWGRNLIATLGQVPPCWNLVETLVPTGYGAGRKALTLLQAAVDRLPRAVADKASRFIRPLATPAPAYVYAIPAGCNFSL